MSIFKSTFATKNGSAILQDEVQVEEKTKAADRETKPGQTATS
jgi:hypothetical protein